MTGPFVVATLLAAGGAATAATVADHLEGASDGPLHAELALGHRAGVPIPDSFVGLSLEDWTLARAAAAGPLLGRLIAPLSHHGPAELRIGGNSGDQTVADPALRGRLGVQYVLTPAWMAALRRTLIAGHARALLGLNFALQPAGVAPREAALAAQVLGPRLLAGISLGNEPDFYSHNRWARTRAGHLVQARGRGWSFRRFLGEYARVAASLPAAAGPLVGPDLGGSTWSQLLGSFPRTSPRVRTLSVHAYELTACEHHRRPTVSEMLDPTHLDGLVGRVQPALRTGRRLGLPVRVTEGNTVACRGTRRVSDAPASALWAPDELFRLAAAGAAGFDLHSSGSVYDPWAIGRDRHGPWARVRPVFYGLLAFERMLGPHTRLLALRGDLPSVLRGWATRDACGTDRLLLLNDDPHRAAVFGLHALSGRGSVTRLLLPARAGALRLGGQSYGTRTRDGRLHGRPVAAALHLRRGTTTLTLAPRSAALAVLVHPSPAPVPAGCPGLAHPQPDAHRFVSPANTPSRTVG